MPGDAVLIFKEGIKRGSYLMGKVQSVSTGEDGLVRKANVEYICGGTKKSVDKAVTSLILIVPVDYQEEEIP